MGQDTASDLADVVCGSAIWGEDHRVPNFSVTPLQQGGIETIETIA